MKLKILLPLLALIIISCDNDVELLTAEENEEWSGGSGTIFIDSPLAFSFQVNNVEEDEALDFFVGNSLFNKNWVTAPASTTARDGLGPFFNTRSCSGCHFKDGRGRPPAYDGELNHGLLLRLSINGTDPHGGPLGDPNYGGQLQDQSITSVETEGDFEVLYQEKTGQYDDGTSYSLRTPIYKIKNLNYGELASDIMISPRVGQHMIGLGLLEAITEETIREMADPDDLDSDGISGKANEVWNVKEGKSTIGKFGWKANQPSLEQQVAGAFSGDLGITTWLFPDENCPQGCEEVIHGGTPEIEKEDLDKVILYAQTLAVPARRNWTDTEVLAGKQRFGQIGCTGCHKDKIVTGTHDISALSNQTIRPYTDMLLHDMGSDLADNRPDYLADGNEWRTPPLWGIGLIETVNDHSMLLHDGRARNIEEAILWHGGEASSSTANFKALNQSERESILKFLSSL